MPEPHEAPPLVFPPWVVRAALTWGVVFGIVWMIGGTILWIALLAGVGSTWPAVWHEAWVALLIAVVQGLWGAVCGLILRILLWLAAERLREEPTRRRPRSKRAIKVAQDWQEL